MEHKQLDWAADIGCEGGPVLVANLDDFRQWSGSAPFDPARATQLHYWSPFTGELPELWQPGGPSGHQYLDSDSPSALREQLMTLVCERWPGTAIDRNHPTWRATRPDGRTLNAALSPESEYDIATRDLDQDGVHQLGSNAQVFLWSAAPGMVRVSASEGRDSLLLAQVEFADDDADAETAYAHARRCNALPAGSSTKYRVSAGPVVVAWSPNGAADIAQTLDGAGVGPTLPGILLDGCTDASAALVWLAPGLYGSTLHYHEEARWAISWCRLHRLDL